MTYPEHEKMAEISDQSQIIGGFLDWLLNEQPYHIAELWEPETDWLADSEFRPIYRSIEFWLAEYFGIDLDKIEEEKIAMLKEIRNQHERELDNDANQ